MPGKMGPGFLETVYNINVLPSVREAVEEVLTRWLRCWS